MKYMIYMNILLNHTFHVKTFLLIMLIAIVNNLICQGNVSRLTERRGGNILCIHRLKIAFKCRMKAPSANLWQLCASSLRLPPVDYFYP